MSKLKQSIIYILIMLSIFFVIYITPKFLGFMETQNNILKIPVKTSQTFQLEIQNNKDLNIDTTYNIPIPKDIKDKMIAENKAKIEAKRIKEEQEKRLKEEKRIKEEKAKLKVEIAKAEGRNNSSVTNRGSLETRDNSGYIKFTATGYCPCSQCCGKNTGITARGTKARAGYTVAMPSSYSFGTQIEIQGMGTYVVEDRGGAIKGNKIDIFFNSHQEALNFGRRTVYLKVL